MKFLNLKTIPGFDHTKKTPNGLFIALVLVLAVFGLVMVYDSSVSLAIRDFSDPFYFVKEQAKWLIAGIIIFFAASRIPYKWWYRIAVPLLMATIALLLAVFIPGLGVKALGARRWINLGFTVLQPAEFAKLALIMYLSAWFSNHEKKRFGPFLLLLGMVVGLVVLEPDLGTAMVIVATAILLYFFSGAPLRHFSLILPVLVVGVVLLSLLSPYRFARLTSFMNPDKDPLGSSYQVRQATLAIGSGGIFGVGLGKSRQKYQYLPEANTDSIFAIIGEETGFIGGIVIISVYLFMTYVGYRIAVKAPDAFGRLLALGVASWVGVQAGINIAANVALIPLTGIPLPLVSYGGSSLIVTMCGLGIVANISRS